MTIKPIGTDSDYLTETQVAQLLRAINPRRVGTYNKNANLSFSHVEAYELRAHLNRILGFARWSEDVVDGPTLIFEEIEQRKNGDKTYPFYKVAYKCTLRLTVCAPSGKVLATYTEGAVGDSSGSTRADCHDNALKNSASYALKRCCTNLGDQFGLSLYRGGETASLVKQTLLMPDVKAAAEGIDDEVSDSVPETTSADPATAPPDPRETTAAPTPEPEAADVESDVRVAQADEIRTAALEAKTAREITQLMVAAGRQSLNNIMVDSAVGPHRIALKQFLDNQIKSVAAASRVAS